MARTKNREPSVATLDGRKDKYAIWTNRLERSSQIWKHYRRNIQRFYDAYYGVFEDQSRNANYIGIPLAYAFVKYRIPALYLKDPFIRVSARTPFSLMETPPLPAEMMGDGSQVVRNNVMGAEILENALAYEMRQMNYKHQVKLAIHDAQFCYGVLKHGYDTQYTYNPVTSPVEKVNATVDGEPDDREGLEWHESVKRESIWALRVDPWDFRYDTDIKSLDPKLSECRWVAFRSIRPLDDVQNDPLYKHTAGLKGSSYPDDNEYVVSMAKKAQGLDEPFCVLWEIWDKKERKIYVMADGGEKFLREEPWPFDYEGFPMVFLYFDEPAAIRRQRSITESNVSQYAQGPFPLSPVGVWYELNHVLNVAESMTVEAMKRRMSKWAFQKGTLEESQIEKLSRPLTNAFVETNGPPDSIRELRSQDFGNGEAAVVGRFNTWLYQISGVSANARGSQQEGSRTATEAAVIQSNVEARIEEAKDRVRDCVTFSAEILVALMKQFFTKQRIVPVIGNENFIWIPYSRENIQGEYDLEVELITFNPSRSEIAVKQMQDLLAMTMKMPMLATGTGGYVQVNQARIVEELLKNIPMKLRPREVLSPIFAMPPAQMPGQVPQGTGNQPIPPSPGGGPPLPGEGTGANNRSPIASQGVGQAMIQAMREGKAPQALPKIGRQNLQAGAATPSRGF